MNRNLDGSELTDEQLFDLAVANGADAGKLRGQMAMLHNVNLNRSILNTATAEVRLSMFLNGKLVLNTRDKWNSR